MTDSTPVRRFILDGYGGVPRTEVVLASDYDAMLAKGAETIIVAGRKLAEVMADHDRIVAAKDAENERLREALKQIGTCEWAGVKDRLHALKAFINVARAALAKEGK